MEIGNVNLWTTHPCGKNNEYQGLAETPRRHLCFLSEPVSPCLFTSAPEHLKVSVRIFFLGFDKWQHLSYGRPMHDEQAAFQ